MIKKCLVLFSGGLDSRLVLKIMQERGFAPKGVPSVQGDINTDGKVLAVYFKLPFCKDIDKEIKEFCKKQKIKLKIFDCTKGKLFKEYLKIIKKPKYGRGSGINPCIDCRIFILKKAKKFADSKNIKFIVTGEVLDERPMSQTKKSMDLIDIKVGLKNKILRPLSDKFFGYNIKGRRRDKQIALAKKFKISYPAPAGGCLLCEKLYCEKLKKIINKRMLNYKDVKLLKIGRHFEKSNIILGRNQKENKLLEKEKGIKVIPAQPGATALIKNKKDIKKAKELIQKYSKHKIKEFKIRD